MKAMNYLFLGATLVASAAIVTGAKAQDDRHQEDNHRREQVQVRVYDRAHRDYHNWDDNEDRTYRIYLGQQHRDYREYNRLHRRQQNQYWNWRHQHPDGQDRREHADGGQERH